MKRISSILTNPPTWALLLVLFSLASLLGYFTLWPIFEQDLYWQVRAGKEILANISVQKTDTWSHTINGKEWLNFQWLSTVVFYLISKLPGDYAALSIFRGIFVTILFFMLGIFTLRSTKYKSIFLAFSLLIVTYVMISFRLQMRPEIFSLCFFTGLLLLLHSEIKHWIPYSFLLLLIWNNFHSGTSTFGFAVFGLRLLFLSEQTGKISVKSVFTRKTMLLVFSLAALYFVNPHGVRAINVLLDNSINYDFSLLSNPDQQPLSLKLFKLAEAGWSIILWGIYAAVNAISLYIFFNKKWPFKSGMYSCKLFITATNILLFALVFAKIRAIPYHVFFSLPIVYLGLIKNLAPLKDIHKQGAFYGQIFITLMSVYVLYDYTNMSPAPIRPGISQEQVPVDCINFLKKNKVQPNLFNSYAHGGYFIGLLPEYPVLIDGRDQPYKELQQEQKEAEKSVAKFEYFLDKYKINVVVDKPPSTIFTPDGGLTDTDLLRFPKDKWALVFFDNAAVIYLRRTKENNTIIEQYEYKLVRRGFPANFYADFKNLPDSLRVIFEQEIDSCLNITPNNAYCLVAKAAFNQKHGQKTEALALLKRAYEQNHENTETIFALINWYEQNGDIDGKINHLKRIFKNKTTQNFM